MFLPKSTNRWQIIARFLLFLIGNIFLLLALSIDLKDVLITYASVTISHELALSILCSMQVSLLYLFGQRDFKQFGISIPLYSIMITLMLYWIERGDFPFYEYEKVSIREGSKIIAYVYVFTVAFWVAGKDAWENIVFFLKQRKGEEENKSLL